MGIRVGLGYDVHKLVEGRKLILGGIDIPYEKGLLGHSDADVLIHAIIDSLAGASKKGDIGRLFPDTDDAFKDISSIELLKKTNNLLISDGFKIINIDCVIVAQKPKLITYINGMEKKISSCLNIEENCISIKATTEEGLGFTGNGEGISAKAICLIEK